MALPPKAKQSFLSRVPLRAIFTAAGAATLLFLAVGFGQALKDKRAMDRMDRDIDQLFEGEKKRKEKE